MFAHIPEDEAIVVENGIEKPVKVYSRDGALYVGVKGGFARVKANGSTSHPATRLLELHRDGPLWQDQFGRLRCDDTVQGCRRIELGSDGLPARIESPSGGMKALPSST